MHAARWGGWSENVGSGGGNAYAWENAPHDIGRQRKNATRAADLAGAPRARTRRASLFSRRRSYSPAIAASSMAFWCVKEPGGLLVGCRTRRVCELTVDRFPNRGCEGGAKTGCSRQRESRAAPPGRRRHRLHVFTSITFAPFRSRAISLAPVSSSDGANLETQQRRLHFLLGAAPSSFQEALALFGLSSLASCAP